jgi:hypothetical protein
MTKLISLMIVCTFAFAGCGSKAKKPDTTTTNTDPTTTTEPTKTAGEGTPCAQEVALVCPDDQIDGCLKTPVEGDSHKCVAK